MYILSVNMWFQKLMKQFFFGIDSVVYNAISSIYDLLISIARTSVLSQADILDMADRIYKLLAIFMIFKVTLSLITYVVNPDDFSDKSKGISKLSLNIVISLGLLILTPYIFNMAYRLQTIILEDNSLATLIFGQGENDTSSNFINTAGDEMAYITMSAFFTPNTSINELQNCIELTGDDGKVNPACSGLNSADNYKACSESSCTGVTNVDITMEKLTRENDNFNLPALQNYVAGVDNKNLGLMFRQEMAIATTDDNTQFIMDYKYIFSTVVGVVVVLLLISFCMDVALRSIKLAFLQLIAPIPILSYVDPKSGKDGMFKKWYQLCFKTYLSLFIRLLALYFAVYIIEKVADLKLIDVVDGSYQTHAFIYIFVIIGALMFAKDLPKILEGLGIKLDGGGKFTLNPLRKMENEMAGGKLLKKPNDALGKLGKGIINAPGQALATKGKQFVAGAYSAANGRGFHRGWSSVDSPFKKSLNKKIDEWAPDFAKDRQEARVARLDAEEAARKEKKVGKYFEKNGGGKERFLDDLGRTDSRYRALYEEAENKKAAMYKAQAASNRWISAINNDELNDNQRAMLSQHFGAKNGELMTDDDLIRNLQKASGTAEKVYKKAEESKESYGKTSAAARRAAELDKSYDSYDKLYVAKGELPKYTKAELDSVQNIPKPSEVDSVSDVSVESSNENSTETVTSDVMDRVENITSVSRESASENGAPTEDDSALKDFFEANTSEEDRQIRLRIESRIRELKSEKADLENKKSVTPDGKEFMRIVQRIKQIDSEIENLRRQL